MRLTLFRLVAGHSLVRFAAGTTAVTDDGRNTLRLVAEAEPTSNTTDPRRPIAARGSLLDVTG